jgi:hypothetical protein
LEYPTKLMVLFKNLMCSYNQISLIPSYEK